jgi:adenine-specific DNA-methyltransferase
MTASSTLLRHGAQSSLPTRPIPDVIEWQYTGNKLHPTQKPVDALRPLVRSLSYPGDIIFDPFCGSGSTLVAAQIEGRDFVGIELDSRYFEIARTRLCPALPCPAFRAR